MEIKKEKWESLRIEAQQFTPQEYVAACWRFCCDCESYLGTDAAFVLAYQRDETGVPGTDWSISGIGSYIETVAEGNPNIPSNPAEWKIHYGIRSASSGHYQCHGDNGDQHEIWNNRNGNNYTLHSNFGSLTITNYVKRMQWDTHSQYGIQSLIKFTTSDGLTHYGREERTSNLS